MIYRVTELFPENFIGVCQLPQSPGVDPKTIIPELERCITEYGFVGCNLNPDPSGGHWNAPPLTDKVLVSGLREALRTRRAGDGARVDVVQSGVPHDRRALHQRRHDGVHAAHHVGPVQGFPEAAADHSAWRRRGAVPLGPLSRACAAEQEHADRGDDQEQRVLRHLRLSSAGHRAAHQGRADRQHPVRVGNDRRGADRSIRTPGTISTTPSATSISVSWLSARRQEEDLRGQRHAGLSRRREAPREGGRRRKQTAGDVHGSLHGGRHDAHQAPFRCRACGGVAAASLLARPALAPGLSGSRPSRSSCRARPAGRPT